MLNVCLLPHYLNPTVKMYKEKKTFQRHFSGISGSVSIVPKVEIIKVDKVLL